MPKRSGSIGVPRIVTEVKFKNSRFEDFDDSPDLATNKSQFGDIIHEGDRRKQCKLSHIEPVY